MPVQVSNKTKPASEPFAFGSKTARSQLGDYFQPSDYSVICARGQSSFNHAGNCRFRTLTGSFFQSYSLAGSKTVKSAIVSDIVATVRQAGGNFCRNEKGAWFEVGDHCAREKVSTLLRDLLHTQYRSSGKAKLAHRRAQNLTKKQNQLEVKQFATVSRINHSVMKIEDARLRNFGTGLNLLADCVLARLSEP
jgi:hypothetical protein